MARKEVQLTDAGRTDPLAPIPGRPRVLSVWLWYPAAAAGAAPAPYAPGAWNDLHLPAPVGWGETEFDAVRTRAAEGGRPDVSRHPLVVLEPGLGLAAPQYTALAENLASQGFIVAGVTPTYSANATVLDGRTVRSTDAGNPRTFDAADLHAPAAARAADALLAVWVADAHFVARALADPGRTPPAAHADLRHVGYVGHSFGGAAALEACRTDPNCTAAVDLDGTQFGPVSRLGLDRPFLLVATDSCIAASCRGVTASCRGVTASATANASDQKVAAGMMAASRGHGRTQVLTGAGHFDLTDYGAYYLAAPLRKLLPLGKQGGPGLLRKVGDDVGAFLRSPTAGRGSSSTVSTDATTVVAPERSLLQPAARAAVERTRALPHQEFIEYGKSCRVWDRDAIVAGADGAWRLRLHQGTGSPS